MRDFFARQQQAHRQTWQLFCFFAVALVVITVVLAAVIYVLFFTFDPQILYTHVTPFRLDPAEWDRRQVARIAGVVALFILLVSLVKYLRLRSGGGGLIARMLGGRIVYPDSTDIRERRLLNIVEEMAIASGVTVPSVYLLEAEWGINAFAAGFTQEDAVLGVTKGALHYLNREELQGVVAHEFSHVLHGDMLINIRIQGVLHGILAIGLLGEAMVKGAFVDDHSSRGQVLHGAAAGGLVSLVAGMVLLVVGFTGVAVARLIKGAICRQREFLADAAAVQFTRNPLGLAGALKKIGGLTGGARLRAPRAAEVSHMYFGNTLAESRFSLLSTHPPLAERIRRLDPDFRGEFPASLKPVEIGAEEAMMYATSVAGAGAGEVVSAPEEDAAESGAGRQHVFFRSLVAGGDPGVALTAPGIDHLRLAREMLDSLPRAVRQAVANGFGARAVLYGLLLHREEEIRAAQLAALAASADPQVRAELARLLPEIDGLLPELRLPLVDLALPALRALSVEQYRAFKKNLALLVKSGGKIDLFEYALHHLLTKHLAAHFNQPSRERLAPITSLGRVRDEISCVLSLLAREGSADEDEARRALMRAVRHFGKEMKFIGYLPARLSGLGCFDQALKRLGGCSPEIRRQVLAACLECMIVDQRVTIREAELFRVIAEALDCPLPPWLTLAGADGPGVDGPPDA